MRKDTKGLNKVDDLPDDLLTLSRKDILEKTMIGHMRLMLTAVY